MANPGRQKPRKTHDRGGYDCEFVQPPPAYFQTECSVCLLVLRSPHLTSCCGKYFCKECIARVQKEGKACPLCNVEGFTVLYNRTHDTSLKDFEVFCSHRAIGCEWKGKLEAHDKHLNADPEVGKQLEGCGFVEVPCSHSCKQSFQRCFVDKHQSSECPERPFSCEHCQEYESTYNNVVTNHWPECKCYPIHCPNACSSQDIQRQHLPRHLSNECPLQEIECEFSYAGCEIKLPRKDMAEHLKETTEHMTLLSQHNHQLMAQLVEKNEQIQKNQREMAERLSTVETKSKRMAVEHHEEMKQMKQRLNEIEAALFMKVEGSPVDHPRRTLPVCSPVTVTMTNFRKLKQDKAVWDSEGFYTHPGGYRIGLRVYPDGRLRGQGTHVSVYICVMHGDFDEHLKWPFRGIITFELLNQREDKHHRTFTVHYLDEKLNQHNSRMPMGGQNLGQGKSIINHKDLDYNQDTNCQYLVNDSLSFRVHFKLL